ncbi:uncharacterized protein Z518_03507 [Rhinocladiella mackenziei CBS 650.93]|uniref:Uncharacterized protein n=1 Tax=Rhinocladiella mackenziei CBS 650.93 TaxID=1442369 RepID=A0A0D2JHM7_9EURO|nr:uncharacterized protein Z518_03507 [Rhinocladiella mackenziei CBS 650.93]KIX08850.1 hypothetical protein Z518_03507 [Rhinocladiella mackenziei CBS 650.93]
MPQATETMSWLLNTLALHKIKEASLATAVQVGQALTENRVEDIPLQVVAWITLPLAVYTIRSNYPTRNQSDEVLTEFDNLKYLLHAMCKRFSGVQHVAGLLISLDKAASSMRQDLLESNEYEVVETKLLIHATRMIHSSLGLGVRVES